MPPQLGLTEATGEQAFWLEDNRRVIKEGLGEGRQAEVVRQAAGLELGADQDSCKRKPHFPGPPSSAGKICWVWAS